MNKIFKVIFSKAKGCYVVVSELAKSAGKGTSASHIQRGYRLTLAAAVLSMMMGMAPVGAAGPVDLGNNAAAAYDGKGNLTIGDAKTVAEGKNQNGENNTTIGTQTDTLRNVKGDTEKKGQPLDDDSNTVLVDGEGKAHDLTKSTEAGGSTAVGYDNHNEGDSSTAIGNHATIRNKPVTYYVDADGNKTASPDNAVWYKDSSGNPTKVPQVFRDAAGNTTATPQYRHTYTEKDPDTKEDVTKTEITSDATKADKDSAGNPVYNYRKEDNTDKLYSVTLYQAASNSIAAGTNVTANGSNAVAVGYNSKADNSAVAIGDTADAGENAVAIGKDTKATVEGSIALGKGSEASREGGVAGWDPKTGTASTKRDVAWKSGEGALSIGNGGASRQITNVAAGSEDSDAVNLAQLKNAMTHYYSVKTTGETDAAGNNNYLNDGATGNNALAAGVGAVATGDNATAVGYNTSASGENAVAVGSGATASGGGVAFGSTGVNASSGGLAVGMYSTNASSYSAAFGLNSTTATNNSVAVGTDGTKASDSSVAVGKSATATNSSVAVGANGTTAANSSFAAGFTSRAGTSSSSSYGNIAVGSNTKADNGSSAFGINATADYQSLAIGLSGNSSSSAYATNQSIAIGNHAQAGNNGGHYAVALGNGATAPYDQTTVIGNSAQATAPNATALGSSASAAYLATALGNGAAANSSYDTAIGSGAATGGGYGTALGYNAKAQAPYATALGSEASASYQAIALGYNAKSNVTGGVALGSGSTAYRESGQAGLDTVSGALSSSTDPAWKSTYGAISVGNFTRSDDGKTVTVNGTRQIVGVAAGSEDTDAVNVAQLKAALRQTGTGTIHDYSVNSTNTTTDTNYNYDADTGSNALAAGVSAKATGVRSVAVGNGAKAQGVDSIAIGTNAVATGIGAMVIGQYNTAEGQNSLAFGGGYNDANKGNKASSTAAVAFGERSWAMSEGSVAFGYGTQAGNMIKDKNNVKYTGQNAVAFGNGTKALGGRSLAFGENTTANYNDSVAFGNGATAFSSGATAFGNRSRALSQYSTSFGDNSVAAGSMSFAFGTDTIAGAALDDNGALELTDGSRMDSYGNKAYTTTDTAGNKVTYSIKGMDIPSGVDVHDYVVVTGTKADGTTGTYVQDYQGGIAEVKVNDDGTVTKVKDLYSGKLGGWYQYDENGKLVTNAKGTYVVTPSAKMTSIPVTLDKATPGSNGYTLKGFKNATAFGYSTEASGDNATAFGNDTKAKAAGATAFGYQTVASGENATAFGENSIAAAKNSLAALGGTVSATATNAAAIGKDAQATLADSVALGSHSVTTRAKYKDLTAETEKAAYAKGTSNGSAWEATDNAIAVGNDSTVTRQITGVAAGSLDTDAVNVAQLKAVDARHTTVSVGGQKATADDTVVKGGNLEMTRTTSNGQANYDVSLNKDIVLGQQEENKGGSIVINSVGTFRNYDEQGNQTDYPMKEAVKIDGTTVSVVKNDGSDGGNDQRQVVMGVGQDTGGYVALYDNTGKKPTYIFNAISPGITYLKDKATNPDDANEFGRLEYGDISNSSTQFIATLDDGLKFSGDQGSLSTVKLNQELSVTGGVTDTNSLSTGSNIGVVSTPAVEDDKGNITHKAKLELKLNKDLTGLNTVTAGTAKIGSALADTLKLTENGAVTEKTAPAGSYVTGLGNKDWDTTNPSYVSGRAATEDQLAKVSEAINNATTAAGKRTVVTVNDKSNPAEATPSATAGAYGDYDSTGGNLMIAAKKDSDGVLTYNIKLNDQLAIGQKSEPGVAGKDGKDGKVTVETKGGTTVVIGHDGEPGKDGKDGLFVTGKDGADGKSGVSITGPDGVAGKDGVDGKVGIAGKDGKDAVSITGKDGVGHIGLTGPKGEKGADGTPGRDGTSIDILTDYGTKTLDSNKNVTVDNKEQASRIIYNDAKGPHEVATMDDGLKIGANAAAKGKAANPVSNKLNSTINIKGSNAKADHTYTDDNLTTTVEQDADGNTTVKVLMDQDITGNSVTVGKDSKDGEDGKAGYDGQEGSIGIAGKNGIDGKNGKQGITTTIIKTEKGQNGKDGEVGKQGAPGVDGKDITRIVYQNGQDGENGQGGKHVVATLDDGLKFVGDDGTATPVTKKLNDTLQIRGDGTYDATTKTNSGNIQTSVEDGTIKVALNDKINLHQDGSLTVGGDKNGDAANGQDPIVIKHFDDKTLDMITGVDKDGKPITSKEGKAGDYVTGLDNKDWDVSNPTYVSGRAATEDQLKEVSNAVTKATETAGKHTVVTVEGGKDAGTTDYNGENLKLKVTDTAGQRTYDLKLNDNLSLGTVGKDGEKGTDGSIGLKGADGKSSIGLNGKDGISVIGKDGKNGVSITGSNGLNGKDGIDGKIAIGTPGKDGQPGKDAVSISGQNGEGHIGLTGPAGKDGKDASADIHVKNGQVGVDGKDGNNGKDGMDRIVYDDHNGKPHEVATMDDGMKFVGNDGQKVTRKLNETLSIKGGLDKDAVAKASTKNLGVRKKDDGLEIVMTDTPDFTKVTVGEGTDMTKKITIGKQTVTGKKSDGSDGAAQTGNYITGLDNKAWDKDNVVENRAATEGQLKDAIHQISGKDQGGFGLADETGNTVKQDLGGTIAVKGDGKNIQTKVKDGGLEISLNKDMKLGTDGSVKAGNTTIDKDGVDTNKVKVGDITITDQGINGGSQQITNIASGIDGKQYADAGDNNAASIGDVKQLAQKEAKASEAKSGKNITVKDDHTVNLNDDITLGNDATKQVTIKGSEGQVTIGTGDNAMTLGKQANTAGDSNPEEGNYLNGLDNRKWDGEHIQNGRAATEDQLKTVSDKVKSGRVFQGDDGQKVTVGLGDTLKIQGGAKDVSSDNNIGIVKGADDTLQVRLAKDLTGLGSVTTGNTTINNGGLTIKTGDANRTITMQDGNVNMGGNQIHHVAPGQAPDDAVNVSQLNATNYAVNKLDTRMNRVGANAAALAALHPLDFDPDDKWDFSAGYGHYKDANAAAVGAFYRPNEDTMFSVGGSFGGGENMVNAGVSVKLGQGNHVSTSRVAMAKEIKDLKKDVAALKAVVNQQSALIDKLTGVNAGELSGSDDLFPDVPANHWAYEYVTRLKQAGILTGYPDGNFAGDRMMTRYEFAAIVYRAIMAGAAANPSLNKDGTLDRLAKEFSSEMKYIRIDTIRKDRNGRPTIQRVRVIKEDEKEK